MLNILADFSPDLSAASNAFQQPMVYNASGSLTGRLVDLTASSPIMSFAVSVYWTDSFGVQRPMMLNGENQSASIKLCFIRKTAFWPRVY